MDKEQFEQELEEWRNIQATILEFLGRCSTETTAYVCGYKPEKGVSADRPPHDYPIGTKFKALNGGYWIRNSYGFKWYCGATFPTPGGDWDGSVCFPE